MNEIKGEIRAHVDVAAYYLSQENHTYDKLCWMLAQRQLHAFRDPRYNQEDRIKEKAAEIFFSGTNSDVLVYLIAELDILIKLGKV